MKEYRITTYEHYGKRNATNMLNCEYKEFNNIDEAIEYAQKEFVWWDTGEEYITCERKLRKSYEQYCYAENCDWDDANEYSVEIELVPKTKKLKKTTKLKKITKSELRDMGYELEEE